MRDCVRLSPMAVIAVLVISTALLPARSERIPEDSALALVGRARISAVYAIEVVPPYAYALERGILRVLDVRDPTAVREVGALAFERPRSHLALRHPYLYLTGYGQPMGIVDVSDPTQPRWRGEWPEFEETVNNGLGIAGDLAYLLRRAKGDAPADEAASRALLLDVLDLRNPARPRRLGSLDLGVDVRGSGGVGMAQAGGRAFVFVEPTTGCRSRLFVVNTRVPDKPQIERTLLLPEGKQFRDVAVRGDLLFLLQWRPAQGLAVYRIEAEGHPELLGEVFDPRFQIPTHLMVHGDVVYATFKGEVDLATFDLSNPGDPKLIHTYTIPDIWAAGLNMTLVSDRLYVAGDGGPTPIFDVSEPREPRLLGHWQFEGGWAGDVVREGKLAIVANVGGGLLFHDVSDPQAPRRLARYAAIRGYGPGDWQWSVAVGANGSRVFVAYQNIPAEVLDVIDPTQPVVMGRFTPRGLVHAVVLTPPHAILGYRAVAAGKTPQIFLDPSSLTEGGGIEVVDLVNPREPHSLAVLDLGQAVTDVALNRGRAVAAHPDGGLTIVDVSNPTQPALLGRLAGSRSVNAGLAIRAARIALSEDGTRAYVAHRGASTSSDPYRGRGTLTVVDLEDPTQPRVLSELALDRRTVLEFSMAARNNHLVLFTGDILIVDVSDPARPKVKVRQPFPPARFWVGAWVGLAVDDNYLYLGAAEDGLWIYRLPP